MLWYTPMVTSPSVLDFARKANALSVILFPAFSTHAG